MDAADASTVIESAGKVTAWNDKSGNNYHASQSNASQQPTYNAIGLNNMGTIGFDGGDTLDTSQFSSVLAQPNSVFIVGKYSSADADGYQGILGGVDASNRHRFLIQNPNTHQMSAGTSLSIATAFNILTQIAQQRDVL